MASRLSRRVALASAAVLLVSAVTAPAVLATTYTDDSDFDTTCVVSGSGTVTLSTTFDVATAGWYWIVWRTDAGSRSKIVGSVLKYYAVGNDYPESATTSRAGPYIVGIVSLSTGARDYLTCSY